MEDIIIEKTESTPAINFNFQQGLFEIKGVSIPEDTEEFYKPLTDALESYLLDLENENIDIVFKFIYINTGTSAVIARIIKSLENLDLERYNVAIKWYHEEGDEDMKDLGDYFHSFTSLPFETIPCEEII